MAKVREIPREPVDDSIFGLASRRKRMGITLEDISRVTKIGMRSLQAIEQGDFSKLPGGIYATNYIRQYARQIDFDETKLLECYYSKMGNPSGLDDSQSANPERKPISRFFRHPLAVFNS